ncbi:hypothetical protein QBC38DRAFT_462584, partial [Podospora fimiseda]
MSDYPLFIKSYQFPGENSPDILLYHVFDTEYSQTPYDDGYYSAEDISAGKECEPLDEGQTCIVRSVKILRRHLDWSNRIPTPFISLWDDEDHAWKEARR